MSSNFIVAGDCRRACPVDAAVVVMILHRIDVELRDQRFWFYTPNVQAYCAASRASSPRNSCGIIICPVGVTCTALVYQQQSCSVQCTPRMSVIHPRAGALRG